MRPNVLLMQTDDHPRWALGCYGNSELRTPSLDYLAQTGVRMRNAFTPTPVCSPARACLWTGRLASQHGLHDYLAEADPEVAAVDWLAGERTLAQILHDQGYQTGLSGKWHLGGYGQAPAGIDYWFGQDSPIPQPQGFTSPWPAPASGIGVAHNRHAIADHAVDFLRQRDRDRPFFLYVGLFATHSPWKLHAERLVQQYRACSFRDIPDDPVYPFGRLKSEAMMATREHPREALAQLYASVSEIDEQVGRLLDELETQGLGDDTLVVYTSDHGLNAGHHGFWGKGNATEPYNMVEESIRVPLILKHPGGLLGGQVRDEMVTHLDLFQTILEHVGLSLDDIGDGIDDEEQARRKYPGRSFRDLCRGDARAPWPEQVFGEYGNLRMVRTRDHKLVLRYPDGPSQLFDLARDPRETRSFLADPEYRTLVTLLTEQIESYFGRYEEQAHSGRRIRELPRHNGDEAWRATGEHSIAAIPAWFER
jgi:arylsulfatase A-like enzyme